ncbi:MAG TPA: ACP S-malonyltransferase, partial [Azospirillum sp.]
MRAFVFPGQGSQRKGMGRDLFALYPDLVRRADAVLGYSTAELCLEDPHDRLTLTAYAQPAIFMVSVLAFIEARKTLPPPDCTAGHSVGEYAALAAAQVFDFETGLRLVARRGALMAEADGGGLAAVVGLRHAEVETLLAEEPEGGLSVANVNTPTQVVVGGPKDALGRFAGRCRARGGRVVPLAVSGAFHTAAMADAARRFHAFLDSVEFRAPAIPVACNLTGGLHDGRTAGGMAEVLARHIERPVLWTRCVERLLGLGVGEFQEIGGTRILTPMVEEIRRSAPPVSAAFPVPAPAADEAPAFGRLVAGSLGAGMAGPELVGALA